MLTLENCKKTLQADGKKYSEEQIKLIRSELYKLAQIVNDTKLIDNEKVD
jgi:hypothetical protein